MIFFTAFATWIASVWGCVMPFIPGFAGILAYTVGTHAIAFGGSWSAARAYSISCVGEGVSGLYNSYWTFGSPTCTAMLFSHVVLLAVAVASMISTLVIFAWVWYRSCKRTVMPVAKEIQQEWIDLARIEAHYGAKRKSPASLSMSVEEQK
jgi:hypothetical protein